MARSQELLFHATTSTGVTITGTTGITGPSVDLGSSTVVRTLLVERRIAGNGGGGAGGFLDITFQDSVDNTTFVNMPGTTSSAALGFARINGTANSYGSTDAIAPSGANAVPKIALRCTKRFVRAVMTPSGTTGGWAGITITGQALAGAFAGSTGPIA